MWFFHTNFCLQSLPLCHYMEAHSPNILTIAERETKHCLSSDVLQIVPNIYLSGHNLCYWTLERMEVYGFTHIIAIDQIDSTLPDGRNQFVGDSNFGNFLRQSGHLLDLCFCEGAYLTTVLPNCYKAVKFIERSMRGNARILVSLLVFISCHAVCDIFNLFKVIDGSGFHRCVTIIVGFIMYKHKMNFM